MREADIFLETDELRWHLTVRYVVTIGRVLHEYGVATVESIEDVEPVAINSCELIWHGNKRPLNMDLPLWPQGGGLVFRDHAKEVIKSQMKSVIEQIEESRVISGEVVVV